MEDKIIYIAGKSATSDRYKKMLEQSFTVEERRPSAKYLYRELIDVKLIIIYIPSIEAERVEYVRTFLSVMPESFMPTLLMGSGKEFKNFKSEVNYPFIGEIDIEKDSQNLVSTVKAAIEKHSKKEQPAPVVLADAKKTVFMHLSMIEDIARLTGLLHEDYALLSLVSAADLFRRLIDESPSLLIIGYDARTPELTESLLRRLRDDKIQKKLPIILYGDPIPKDVMQKLLPYHLKGFCLRTNDDASVKKAVSKAMFDKTDVTFKVIM